ncbi:MAG TPA: RNA polymerase sigma factor, partial [Bellilinea sp.]|nr:RNA polymerase sigma factor [Bellilinea sp.]
LEPKESRTSQEYKLDAHSLAQQAVMEAIQADLGELQSSIGVYVRKFDLLMSGETYQDVFNELLHETIAAALESADRLKPGQPVIAWLRVIAMNKAREMVRRQIRIRERVESIDVASKRRQPGRVSPETYQETEKIPDEEKLDAILYRSSKRDLLVGEAYTSFEELLSLVDDKDAEVLELIYFHGLHNVEVAAELGISEGAANVRVSRARSHLKKNYRSLLEKTRKENDQDE